MVCSCQKGCEFFDAEEGASFSVDAIPPDYQLLFLPFEDLATTCIVVFKSEAKGTQESICQELHYMCEIGAGPGEWALSKLLRLVEDSIKAAINFIKKHKWLKRFLVQGSKALAMFAANGISAAFIQAL